MGVERTLMCFLQNLFSPVPKSELIGVCKVVVENCEICKLTKAKTPKTRGIVSALPIPQIANSLLYIDFVNMDEWNGFTYILTIVDGLTRFAQFLFRFGNRDLWTRTNFCDHGVGGEGKFIVS